MAIFSQKELRGQQMRVGKPCVSPFQRTINQGRAISLSGSFFGGSGGGVWTFGTFRWTFQPLSPRRGEGGAVWGGCGGWGVPTGPHLDPQRPWDMGGWYKGVPVCGF